MDRLIIELCNRYLSDDAAPVSVVALGGYGRGTLFPHSDVDLLFVCQDADAEQACKASIAAVVRELWDMRIRVSPFTRTLAECAKLSGDNLEFIIALLDARQLWGPDPVFQQLRSTIIPRLLQRERSALVRDLVAVTRDRHRKFGDTAFHLEPNLKDGPGGLRDLNVVHWLGSLARQGVHAAASQQVTQFESFSSPFEFLAAARCFLHYRNGRDNNLLSYERQAEAADESIGIRPKHVLRAADWTRLYFRAARQIHRGVMNSCDSVPLGRSTLFTQFEQWRSRLSNTDYSVVNGQAFVRQRSSLQDLGAILGLFEFVARHELKLSSEAERQVRRAIEDVASHVTNAIWESFRRILVQPAAACSLRAMHELGVLHHLVPEFDAIDSLVVGDYYHRYTVDEHSFRAIEILHALAPRNQQADERFLDIFGELEQPELLFLALLLHDVGKGTASGNHIHGSLAACDRVCSRLNIAAEHRETVRFLIGSHLEMSATLMRRDIFDPHTISAFATKVGTPERLKTLCLLTYADISAVSPETLTPWKADALWQLYVSTSNFLLRGIDSQRIDAASQGALDEEAGKLCVRDDSVTDIFLRGLPRRYVMLHSPAKIATHRGMAEKLAQSAAQLQVVPKSHGFELTVVTRDRPGLFAAITGILAAWRMSVLKADAFANAQGIVVDTFQFADICSTLTLNPSELERFQRELVDLVSRDITSETLQWLGERLRRKLTLPKVAVQSRIWFDDASSCHSTIMEVVTRDRPGLLYDIASTLANDRFNIDVALIDTEGQKAIDVLYLTHERRKLTLAEQHELRAVLSAKL